MALSAPGQMDNVLSIEFPQPVPDFVKIVSLLFVDIRKFVNFDCWCVSLSSSVAHWSAAVRDRRSIGSSVQQEYWWFRRKAHNQRLRGPDHLRWRMRLDVFERAPHHRHSHRGRWSGCDGLQDSNDLSAAEPFLLHLPAVLSPSNVGLTQEMHFGGTVWQTR